MRTSKAIIIFCIIITASLCFAQTGDLKIFSEIDSLEIYIDNDFKGVDTKIIKGLDAGSHYLKVVKDGAGIMSELIIIKEGLETSILIKNSPDITKKIIEAKQKEIEEYTKNRLSVQTDPNGKWYMFRGPDIITEREFALIVGDTATADAVRRRMSGVTVWENIGGVACLTGTLTSILFFVNLLIDTPFITFPSTDFEAIVGTSCIMTGLLGYGIMSVAGSGRNFRIMSFDQADQAAKKYNEKLKKALGLPKEYDAK